MIEEILFAGFGGQGILLAGKLLAQSAMEDQLFATWFPSYGPEMRGGTANCTVVYSDDEIGSPIASEYDSVVAMNQPSYEKFLPKVKKGGQIFINSTLIEITTKRDDISLIEIPANQLAIELGNDKVANIVILGAFNAYKGHVKSETLLGNVLHEFEKKGDSLVALNNKAFTVGEKSLKH